jgi:hypothetical protein
MCAELWAISNPLTMMTLSLHSSVGMAQVNILFVFSYMFIQAQLNQFVALSH